MRSSSNAATLFGGEHLLLGSCERFDATSTGCSFGGGCWFDLCPTPLNDVDACSNRCVLVVGHVGLGIKGLHIDPPVMGFVTHAVWMCHGDVCPLLSKLS